ncbi:ATP12 family chaperone protein [Aestuariivirga sp.]|uniref:ATP12 family chaperone protein n=1 Tax=Aestuariivirga sp. TaxID=2650926 RepID=UPI00391C2144
MSGRRRFYKSVSVTGDLGIALDGRPVKTPMKAPLRLPTRALAEAVAGEWDAQREKIDPASMIFTRLANTAIDRVGPNRERIEAEVLEYANSDLVCYRADRPPQLVERHAREWDPVVDWARTTLDAPFEVTVGVIHKTQPTSAISACEAALEELNDFELAAFHAIMTLTGSALIALMLARRAAVPEAAWIAAHVDEDYQVEQWGQDEEAQVRRAARYTEFIACCRFLALAHD